jgi:hypothetical protein
VPYTNVRLYIGEKEMNILFFIVAVVAHLRNGNEYVTSTEADERGIPTTGKAVLRACLTVGGEVPSDFDSDETDEAFAIDALDWIRMLSEEERDGSSRSSRYLKKLHKEATGSFVSVKNCNLLASLPRAYFQYLQKQSGGTQFAESQHVGEVGGEYTGILTVVDSRVMPNRYNPSRPNHLHRFTDPKGNLLVWWTTSTKQTQGVNSGDEILLTGQVKGHDEYEGTPQTTLRRCHISKV